MKIYNIKNQKDFTKKLFIDDVFDNFLVVEANFVTSFTTILDGNKTRVEENEDSYTRWSDVKNIAYNVIKGQILPKSFKIVLKLSSENALNTLNALNLGIDQQTGFYLNIKYLDGTLNVVTGTSTSSFEISKDLSSGWDMYLEKFLSKKDIEFEEI